MTLLAARSTIMIDWVPAPSLVTARNLPFGLSAMPNGLSPNSVCVPAGLTNHPWGVTLSPLPSGPAEVPGGLGADAVSVVGDGGVKVTFAVPSASTLLPRL